MTQTLRILILEDRPADAELVMRELRKEGIPFTAECVTTETEFLAQLRDFAPDLILADYALPAYDGLSALAASQNECPETPFIFVSGSLGEETAIGALHQGATDFVLKQGLSRLGPAVQRALREVGERKRAKTALAESRGLRKAILDNIPDPAWFKDTQGRFLACNESLAQHYGRKVEEILGKTVFDTIPSEAERMTREDQQVIATGKPLRSEQPAPDAPGQRHWFDTIKSPIFNERGEVIGIVGIARETTERRQTDEALRVSEERFRSVWERSIDGMRLIDREGRILAVNEAFCRLVKLPRERLIGEVFSVAYAGNGPDEDIEAYRRRFDAGTIPPRLTATKRLWNSDELDVEISSSFVELDGQNKTLLSIFRDVAERKRAEQRVAAFSHLGQQLGAVKSVREAAEIIVSIADQLLGWDACTLDLYAPERDRMVHVLNRDTINGRREDFPAVYHDEPPSPRLRRTIEGEGQLILRDPAQGLSPDATPFGDTARPSASMIFVPISDGPEVVGVLSIHSYKPKAYDQRSFATLQALADHCAGALNRISAQEALAASEANYRSRVELSPDSVFLHCDGKFVYANPAGLKLLRADQPQQVLGRSVFDFVPPESREIIRQRIERVAKRETAPLLEEKIRRLDGTALDVEAISIPCTYEGKAAVQTIMRDITERKRAEQRIAAFSRLGQQLSAARSAREAGEIIFAVADQLLGWDACTLDLYSPELDLLVHVLMRDTINGQRVDCTFADQTLPPPPLARQIVATGGLLVLKDKPAMLPGTVPFGDTTRPSASLLFVPVRDGAKVIGILSIQSYTPKAYDQRGLETLQMLADHCAGALKRISAQEALGASEANYRSLVERSPDAIFLHCDGKFVYANPATLKLLGAEKPQQVLGLSVFDIVPPENLDLVSQRIRQAAEGGVNAPLEQKVLRLDGTSLEAEVTSIPFTYGGKPAVQTIMRDITERKQLEQQLRQSQKMDAIGQLAGGVAHDFNNMLAVIRGNAELVLMDADEFPAQARECLQQVTAASERAANLTRQLLAFSRKQLMQTRSLVFNDVIADLTKMLRRIIGEHINLECRYGSQLPFVQADPGMIEQVLLNLAVNARDAMPRGGNLLVTTEAASFDAAYARAHPDTSAGDFVCLTVSDTGTGIAPEHLPHIFEPFFTTKDVGKGTGLGLATVYGIVKQHQGWIEVSSQLGAGATFKIFLPASPTPAKTTAAAKGETGVPGGTETILLVEDEYAVRMITRRVLESHGYKVHEATTATEALEVWRGRAAEIALLLTDIVMPQGVTGRELAEQLRAQRPALKIIFMSGYSADVIGKDTDFFRRTQSSFLQKPCSARVVLETVRRCLDAK